MIGVRDEHFLLLYDTAADYLERRSQFRAEHLALVEDMLAKKALVLAGPLAEPVDGAVLLFQGESAAVAEDFAKADPYVSNGLITKWRVREWTTVAGEAALNPL